MRNSTNNIHGKMFETLESKVERKGRKAVGSRFGYKSVPAALPFVIKSTLLNHLCGVFCAIGNCIPGGVSVWYGRCLKIWHRDIVSVTKRL